MQYTAVRGSELKEFLNAVNRNLKDGWEALGGLVVMASEPPPGVMERLRSIIKQ